MPDGARVVVAVSGGLDSMVLLTVLARLAAAHDWSLQVAHFDHRLRGRASAADARFVAAMARKLGLRCHRGAGDVRGEARRRGVSVEMAARELRHRFLAGVARQCRARFIALAHQADDQVESFFLRLLRGAGSDGLAGMDWTSPSPADHRLTLVRPLLDVAKADLAAFARGEGLRHREDTSNRSTDFLRNRVRHELLPLLRRRFQPALETVVLRLMEILRDESDCVGKLAADWEATPARPSRGRGSRAVAAPAGFVALPRAVQRRILQRELLRVGLPPDFERIEWLRTHPGQALSVAPTLAIRLAAQGRLERLAPASAGFSAEAVSVPLRGAKGGGTFAGLAFQWRLRRGGAAAPSAPQPGREVFDADRIGPAITLRHWRPGDRFQPIGLARAAKLQDLFTNAKVPRAERHARVVAATAAGGIFWVEGLRLGERGKLTPATRRVLEWRWRRGVTMVAAEERPC